MWARIFNICRKEVTDSLRDRKGLTQAILVPLILGIFYASFNPWINSMVASKAVSSVAIPAQGVEYAGQGLLDLLKAQNITLEPFTGDLQAAVAKGDQQSGLIIPAGFSQDLAAERPATLTLLTNPAAGGIFGGSFSASRLDLAIETYSRMVSGDRVQVRNIDPALLKPIALETRNLASPEQLAGVFAAFSLPLLLVLIVGQGGLFVAIDVTAGEKERGTLESLLVTPASDFEVLTGKLAAVFSISCVPLVLTFLGFWATSNLLPTSITNGAVVPFSVILWAILVGIPLALFVNVILMIFSVRTRTFKDAQSAAGMIIFALMVPAFAVAFVTPTDAWGFLVPVYGPSAVVAGMAIGSALPAFALLASIIGSLLASAAGFLVALRLFNRERLLYSV
jgi:sodium transport system permease protein